MLYSIFTDNLSFSYGHRKILHDLSLEVPKGSIFGFLGPNGAGKTTTIKCLLGLLHAQDGKIEVAGFDLKHQRLEILKRSGAMVEAPSLYDHLSATRNLKITAGLRNVNVSRVGEVLQIVGLTNDAHRPVKQFSTGMKQRLSLAIALLAEPELLILDEPINGLDPGGILEIRTLLQNLNKTHSCTIFLSSHILSEIEKLCTHVGVIHQGRLLYQGLMEGILAQRGGKLVYSLETSNNILALGLVDAGFLPESRGRQLFVQVSTKTDIAHIVRLLAAGDIDVYEVRKEDSDLEHSFLELIQEP